jgi:hypothetical protein
MISPLRTKRLAWLALFALVLLLLIGLPSPVTAADSELSSWVERTPAPTFAILAASWLDSTYDRTTVIRIAVVVMAVGLFILLRK